MNQTEQTLTACSDDFGVMLTIVHPDNLSEREIEGVYKFLSDHADAFTPSLRYWTKIMQTDFSRQDPLTDGVQKCFENLLHHNLVLAFGENGEGVIGILSYLCDIYTRQTREYGPSLHIPFLFVDPKYQHSGIEKELFQMVIDENNTTNFTVQVGDWNDSVIDFLESDGFEEISRVDSSENTETVFYFKQNQS